MRDNVDYLAAEYSVKRVGLFGSYAVGTANEASDIDLLVEFQRPIGFKFMELAEYLERLLGKKVDILTLTGVEAIRVPGVADHITEHVMYV